MDLNTKRIQSDNDFQIFMSQTKENKIHICHCGKSFKEILELEIHKKVKHNQITGTVTYPLGEPDLNDSNSSSQVSQNGENKPKITKKSKILDPQISKYRPKEAPIIQPSEFINPTVAMQPTVEYREEIKDDEPIFMCGCNHKIYDNKEQLCYHIKCQHMNFPPDGSLFGVTKKLVWEQFKPAVEVPAFIEEKTPVGSKVLYRFICGCGSKFTSFQALDFHIEKKHQNIEPQGTIGGRKFDPLKIQQDHGSNDPQEPSESIKSSQQKYPVCLACEVQCQSTYLKCKQCSQWRICGQCELGNTSKLQHVKKKHTIYRYP